MMEGSIKPHFEQMGTSDGMYAEYDNWGNMVIEGKLTPGRYGVWKTFDSDGNRLARKIMASYYLKNFHTSCIKIVGGEQRYSSDWFINLQKKLR